MDCILVYVCVKDDYDFAFFVPYSLHTEDMTTWSLQELKKVAITSFEEGPTIYPPCTKDQSMQRYLTMKTYRQWNGIDLNIIDAKFIKKD